jgi:hypothetical protein
MMAKFNPWQNMQNGGTTVMAWGPLFWSTDPGARRSSSTSSRSRRTSVTATNSGGDTCVVGEANWNLPLTTAQGQKLRSGLAKAHGVVTVIDPPGGEPKPWQDEVELH